MAIYKAKIMSAKISEFFLEKGVAHQKKLCYYYIS